MLLAGVPGVPPADVVIIGGGVVGTNAAKIAAGMGADVTILDMSPDRMRELDDIFLGRVKTVASNATTLEEGCRARGPPDRRGADPGRRGAEARDARRSSRR